MRNKILMIVSLVLLGTLCAFVIMSPQLLFYRPAVTTQFPNRIQEVLPSVIHIMGDNWQGSGVALTEDIIVTARHVIDGANYSITMNDGTVIKGIQAITHKDYDIGFIKIEPSVDEDGEPIVLTPAKFGSVKDCVLGQPLFVIGSAGGAGNFNSISLGIVSGLNRGGIWKNFDGEDYGWSILFQTDAEGMGGNSGCPVFSMDGIVRGIWVGSVPPAVHYSIPADIFMKDIENIKLMFAFEKYKVEEVIIPGYGYSQGY